jgi:putative oxidoreductase
MTVSASQSRGATEPRLLIPALAPFYAQVHDLAWLIIRVAVGGTLLTHGWGKVSSLGASAVAASLARRGIEPSLVFAYVVMTFETVGAICLILGLFTLLFAAMIAVEFAVITFVAHFPNGYGWTSQGGGWEFPLLMGLLIFAIALRGGGPYSLDRKLGWQL